MQSDFFTSDMLVANSLRLHELGLYGPQLCKSAHEKSLSSLFSEHQLFVGWGGAPSHLTSAIANVLMSPFAHINQLFSPFEVLFSVAH
jgi:hypothetical protein